MTSRPDRERTAGGGAAAFLDLALTAVLAAAVVALDATGASLGPVRVVLGALFVFVLPGYAVTAALFPARTVPASESRLGASDDRATVSPTERAVLAVGLSLAVTALTVLTLNLTGFGVGETAVLNGVCAVVLAAVVVAGARRVRLPPQRRFRLASPGGDAGGAVRSLPTTHVLIAVFLLASVGLVGATLTGPQNGERYTEFYLLTDNGENGTLVADEYPQTLETDQPRSLYVGVENRETRTVEYTVVAKLQRIEASGDERRVVEEVEIDRFSTTLRDGETYREQRELTADPTVTGERLRLIFLLYDGAPPDAPTEVNAYRSTHIWVNASA